MKKENRKRKVSCYLCGKENGRLFARLGMGSDCILLCSLCKEFFDLRMRESEDEESGDEAYALYSGQEKKR